MHPYVQDKIKQEEGARAQTGLSEMLNPPRTVETGTSEDAETANAAKNIATQQAGIDATTNSPLTDLLAQSKVPSQTQAPELGKMLTPPAPVPLQTQATDVMPSTPTTTATPKPGDADYINVPKGMPADDYGMVMQKHLAPSLSQQAAMAVQRGDMTLAEGVAASKAGSKPQIQMVKDANGNMVGVEKKLGDSGVNTGGIKRVKNNEVVTDPDGQQKVVTYWVNPQNPDDKIAGGETRDPLAVRTAYAQEQAKYRFRDVTDTETNTPGIKSAYDLRNTPFGQYASTDAYTKALQKRSFTEDIRSNVGATRDTLSDPKLKDFTPDQAAQMILFLGDPASRKNDSAWNQFLTYGAGKTLTPEQRAYGYRLRSIGENMMSLRVLQGMGQGAEDQREMMRVLIPSGTTVSKRDAAEQLNLVEQTISSVERGMLKAKLNPPEPITDANGITSPEQLNNAWSTSLQQLKARGMTWNPHTREWDQVRGGQTPAAPTGSRGMIPTGGDQVPAAHPTLAGQPVKAFQPALATQPTGTTRKSMNLFDIPIERNRYGGK